MSMLKLPLLKRLAERLVEGHKAIRWIDLYAAQYVVDCHGSDQSDAIAALTLSLSFAGSRGATSLDLSQVKAFDLPGVRLPEWDINDWRDYLQSSSAVDNLQTSGSRFGQAELAFNEYDNYPLVLDGDKLYFERYWQLEQRVNSWLENGLANPIQLEDKQWEAQGTELRRLFNLDGNQVEMDWQACAAAQALSQKVCMITGGPGTGKTTTAANILSLLLNQHKLIHEHSPKVSLLAPTGKAAIRLQQSIQEKLNGSRQQAYLPESGETIHRFLIGVKKARSGRTDDFLLAGSNQARADVDIVLIDEASMIDIALMAELVHVLPEHARVIFLGDHYQLPAIEPGQIFADWVRKYDQQPYAKTQINRISLLLGKDVGSDLVSGQASENVNPVCQLQKTYRFGGSFKRVAELMKSGSADELKSALSSLDQNDAIRWCDLNDPQLYTQLARAYDDYFQLIQASTAAEEMAQVFSHFQVLCSTHEGLLGTQVLNDVIERHHGRVNELYHGKAIMVTENHADLGIFNGDIGFYIRKPSGHFVVAFPDASVESSTDKLIEVAPASIRAWQAAYAITVHKSQGSEYEQVSLVIPDYAKELLSRAMLYTGLTRGKQGADLWLSPQAIDSAQK